MNLLADFRHFQYMLPQIRGVHIHMQDKQTYIRFPRNRYDDVSQIRISRKHISHDLFQDFLGGKISVA